MKAKDTEMSKDEMLGCSLVSKFPFKLLEGVIKETCVHQAEISFEAGKQEVRREVVEWIKNNEPDIYSSLMDWTVWQAQLKEWGIEDGQ